MCKRENFTPLYNTNMNNIDVSQISDPLVEQGFTGPSLKFLQDAQREIFSALGQMQALIRTGAYNILTPYALFGCVDTVAGAVHTITAGAIYFIGEVYIFPGKVVTVAGGQVVEGSVNTTPGLPDPMIFSDNSTKNVHNVIQIDAISATAGSHAFDWTAIVSLQPAAAPAWTTINSFLNSWVDTSFSGGTNVTRYKIDADKKIVRLSGIINSGATGTSFTQLPVGARPANRCYVTLTRLDAANKAYALVDTDGNVYVNFEGGGSGISLEGVTFPLD
jgi:hypothetical protein